jgi:hypothetical protein
MMNGVVRGVVMTLVAMKLLQMIEEQMGLISTMTRYFLRISMVCRTCHSSINSKISSVLSNKLSKFIVNIIYLCQTSNTILKLLDF